MCGEGNAEGGGKNGESIYVWGRKVMLREGVGMAQLSKTR